MKRFFQEYFQVPKDGKVTDKVMITRVVTTSISIITCLIIMSLTALAYFTSDVTSAPNQMQSASWDVTVTSHEGLTETDGLWTLHNETGEEVIYHFEIKKSDDATASVGYTRIEVKTDLGEVQHFYSEPIGEFLKDGEIVTDLDRTIQIAVPAGKTATVHFTGMWGSCALPNISLEGDVVRPEFTPTIVTTYPTPEPEKDPLGEEEETEEIPTTPENEVEVETEEIPTTPENEVEVEISEEEQSTTEN